MVGEIGLMGALSISVIERTKEIGILRAVGARSRTIVGMFVLEGLVQGCLSWLAAVPISLATTPSLATILGKTMFGADLSYRYNPQAVLVSSARRLRSSRRATLRESACARVWPTIDGAYSRGRKVRMTSWWPAGSATAWNV